MPAAVIEAVRDKILAPLARDDMPSIVWHAGEPTAAPLSWYEHAYTTLTPVCPPKASFALQTNGIAIDDRWIEFICRTRTNAGLSIDGPQRFHDARRQTRSGAPTWALAMRALRRLHAAGLTLNVISVLHSSSLQCSEEYYRFYRDNEITDVSFSIDEKEGANAESSFGGSDYKEQMTVFLTDLLEYAYRDGFPLKIREVERIAQVFAGVESGAGQNEQVEPWDAVVVAVDGSVSTFSPELAEVQAPQYSNFIFGNILEGDFENFAQGQAFRRVSEAVSAGNAACRAKCRYFDVCGGGSPVNKFCERGDLTATETVFCRNSTQAAADALLRFLSRRGAVTQPALHADTGARMRDGADDRL